MGSPASSQSNHFYDLEMLSLKNTVISHITCGMLLHYSLVQLPFIILAMVNFISSVIAIDDQLILPQENEVSWVL